jgi:hypothetical protein
MRYYDLWWTLSGKEEMNEFEVIRDIVGNGKVF